MRYSEATLAKAERIFADIKQTSNEMLHSLPTNHQFLQKLHSGEEMSAEPGIVPVRKYRSVAQRANGTSGDDQVSVDAFKAAMGSLATGVTVVTALDASGAACAVTATSCASVSLDPPSCLVCVHRTARAHAAVKEHGSFAVNILSDSQEEVSLQCSSSMVDRLNGIPWVGGEETGAPILDGVLAWMECDVVAVHTSGDHDIIVGRIRSVHTQDGTPLVYWRSNYVKSHSDYLRASAPRHSDVREIRPAVEQQQAGDG
jgi:flavin reductase (DIM6/NTAB) family NADH-FMN oxidoreductase RutF